MTELEQLETRYAPCMTKIQCEKRCSALQATIDSTWTFIHFMNKLDPAMRLALFNYLYTQPTSNTYDNHIHAVSDLTTQSLADQTEDKTEEKTRQTKTLSPRKRKQKARNQRHIIV